MPGRGGQDYYGFKKKSRDNQVNASAGSIYTEGRRADSGDRAPDPKILANSTKLHDYLKESLRKNGAGGGGSGGGSGSGGYYTSTPDPRPALLAAARADAEKLRKAMGGAYKGAAKDISLTKKDIDKFYNTSQRKGKESYKDLIGDLRGTYDEMTGRQMSELERLGQTQALPEILGRQTQAYELHDYQSRRQGRTYDDLLQLLQGNSRDFVGDTANSVRMAGANKQGEILKALQAQLAQIRSGPGGSRTYHSGGGGSGGGSGGSGGMGDDVYNKGYGSVMEFAQHLFNKKGAAGIREAYDAVNNTSAAREQGMRPEQWSNEMEAELVRRFGPGARKTASDISKRLQQQNSGWK